MRHTSDLIMNNTWSKYTKDLRIIGQKRRPPQVHVVYCHTASLRGPDEGAHIEFTNRRN